MTLRLAIFDCDGTLADSEATIVDAIRAAFTEHDLANPARADISRHIGLSLDAFLAAVAPGVDPEKATRIVDSYRQHYARLRTERGGDPLFPGLAALLPELRENGILLGVATGKSRRGLRKFLEAHDLTSGFATLQTADDAPSKPHPGMIERALAETGTEKQEAVMIGDTTFDMGAALNADVTAIGVNWGHHDRGTLLGAGAECVVENTAELRLRLLGL
jgi:phosphoglycolate phosphatase